MTIYYVYMYLREDFTPYYVGKGKNRRYKEKHNVPIPPLDRIRFVQTELTNEEAIILEKQLISEYGRKDLGTGILRNLTNGGEGLNPGPETRAKQSAAKQNYKPWNTGKIGVQTHSKETRDKMRLAKLKPIKEAIMHECVWCKQIKAKNLYCSNSCKAKHQAQKRSILGLNGFQNKNNQSKAQMERRPVRLYGGAHTADIKSSS